MIISYKHYKKLEKTNDARLGGSMKESNTERYLIVERLDKQRIDHILTDNKLPKYLQI